MCVDRGHFKLWRKIVDSPVWDNEGLLKVWIWCLMSAAEEKAVVEVNIGRGRKVGVPIEPGQFIYSRAKAASELRMPESTVRNHIELLTSMGQLDKSGQAKRDKRATTLTITKWNTYNSEVSGNGQARTSETGQARTSEKAGKEEGHEEAQSSPVVLMFPTVGKDARPWALTQVKLDEYVSSYPGIDALAECRKALQWCRDNPKKRKTNAGMGKFLCTWLGKAQDRGKTPVETQPALFSGLPGFSKE